VELIAEEEVKEQVKGPNTVKDDKKHHKFGERKRSKVKNDQQSDDKHPQEYFIQKRTGDGIVQCLYTTVQCFKKQYGKYQWDEIDIIIREKSGSIIERDQKQILQLQISDNKKYETGYWYEDN
jgi:hypothetical protein